MSLGSDEMETSDQKPYVCKTCNERFGTKHYLSFHMTKAHPNVLAFECDICQKAFRLAIHLEIHKSTCKPSEPEENPSSPMNSDEAESSHSERSSESGRKKKTKDRKKNPEKRSRKENKKVTKKSKRKPETEETIDEMFKKPQSEFLALRERKELERLPSGETITWTPETIDGKFYQRCSFCKKLLANSEKHRKIHTNRHLGIKPHVCEYCGAGFSTEDAHSRHIRTHTNEKPFACKFCPERFTCPQTLKFHTRAHSNVKLYQCEHCKEKFIRYCTMQSHILNKHVL